MFVSLPLLHFRPAVPPALGCHVPPLSMDTLVEDALSLLQFEHKTYLDAKAEAESE